MGRPCFLGKEQPTPVTTSCRNDDHHAPQRGTDNKRRLALTLALAVGYMIAELVGGLFYHNYPGGAGLMAGAVFGRIAGSAAAKA